MDKGLQKKNSSNSLTLPFFLLLFFFNYDLSDSHEIHLIFVYFKIGEPLGDFSIRETQVETYISGSVN